MSFFYFFIFLCFVYYASKHFKQSVLMFAPMKILFHTNIFLIDSSFFLSFDTAITLVFFLFYIQNARIKRTSFPLLIPYIIYGLSCIIYALYPSVSIGQFQRIISELLFTYIFFQVLSTKEDIFLAIRYFMIIGYILMLNGLLDWLTKFNLIGEIMKACSGPRFWSSDNAIARFGIERTKSFLPHSISFGVVCAMMLYFMTFVLLNIKVKHQKLIFFLVCLLFVGVILSNSRTPLIALAIGSLGFIDKQLFKVGRLVVLSFLIITFSFLFGDYLLHLIDTVFNEDKVSAQGSTTELRQNQLNAALYYFSQYPIFGTGDKFNILDYEDINEVMGMESEVFDIIYKRGLVGITAHIFFYLSLFILLFKGKFKIKIIFFIALWITACIFSSLPGLDLGFFLVILILLYKISIYGNPKRIPKIN